MKVTGTNLVNVCKLIFKISKDKSKDTLFKEQKMICKYFIYSESGIQKPAFFKPSCFGPHVIDILELGCRFFNQILKFCQEPVFNYVYLFSGFERSSFKTLAL